MTKKDIIKVKKGEVIHEAKIDGEQYNDQTNLKIILGVVLIGVVLFSILFL